MNIFTLKRFAFALVGGLLVATTLPADPPAAEPSTLNVMSWNIRYDNPRDGLNAWQNRKDRVAETVKTQGVDIAGLQEVLVGQLNDLKERLPDMASYGVGRDDGEARGEFAPILFRRTRFELLDKSTFWLSRTPNKIGSRDWDAVITRIASWVKLKDRRTKRIFYVINTHFDHRGREARVESAALLVRQVRDKFSDHPVILTGDFNATPDSTPYKTLVGVAEAGEPVLGDALHRSAKKPEGPNSTWNGFRSVVENRRIDFVFVNDSVHVLRHWILDDQRDGRFASDHLPVLTTLDLPDPLRD